MTSARSVLVEHDSRASAHLDAVRALAAFAVFAGHTRNLFFTDHQQLAAAGVEPSIPVQFFYLLTGLGHQAVMVFFVLSGLFVGQAVRSRHAAGTWSWLDYLVDRVSRLHIVLLPALVLTLAFDWLGMRLMPALYAGAPVGNVVAADVAARHGVWHFVLNNLYLQTILAPTFGSNGALWSLANEFWYYVLFPLAVRFIVSSLRFERIVSLILGIGFGWLVGAEILKYFPMWLLGAALTVLPRPVARPVVWRALSWSTAAFAIAALTFARFNSGVLADYVVALSVAGWAYVLAHRPGARQRWTSPAAGIAASLAAFSYTLYAVHLPFVILVRASLGRAHMGADRALPSPGAFALYGAVLIAGLGLAWLVSRFTEVHTGALRRALKGRLRVARGTS